MWSGRKEPLEALQVQDHRALRKAEAWSPLQQGAWKPACLPEAYLALGILSHLTQLSRKDKSFLIRDRGAPCGYCVLGGVSSPASPFCRGGRLWSLSVD